MTTFLDRAVDGGGADQVVSYAIKQYEKEWVRIFANDGTVDKNPLDVSTWSVQAYAELAAANSDNGTKLDWLEPVQNYFPNVTETTIPLSAQAGGTPSNRLQALIPRNIFPHEIPIGAPYVPVALVYIRADPGPDSSDHIWRMSFKIYATLSEFAEGD